jgi:hypothetical protein
MLPGYPEHLLLISLGVSGDQIGRCCVGLWFVINVLNRSGEVPFHYLALLPFCEAKGRFNEEVKELSINSMKSASVQGLTQRQGSWATSHGTCCANDIIAI